MTQLGLVLVVLPVAVFAYAYFGYPAVMWLLARGRDRGIPAGDPPEWPEITIALPVYNEERSIRTTLESLLALDYPAERRHILVVSDASADGTDDIVRDYAGRGVRLVRLPARGGKTAAENAAAAHVQGTIIVNTDATIRILPPSLKALVRAFQDPRIGLASGRDVSVGDITTEGNQGESGYVGYEMWLRSLETRAGSIVGASGCFYAVRRELFDELFPAALSRDFAAAVIAAERGFRAVSVDEAVCLVPRTRSLRAEFRRKVRTMTRGLETLWYKRRVMGPARPLFSFALLSHKLVRWLVFLLAPLVPLGLLLMAPASVGARIALVGAGAGVVVALVAFAWPESRKPPRLVALMGFVGGAQLAGFLAWMKAFRGELNPTWEPTRRP